jgi:hypothetical protein
MATKSYYVVRVNPKTGKKTITLDGSITPTPVQLQAVQTYVNAGYEIRFKSEKRAAAAAKRAKETGFGKKAKKEAAAE